MTSVHVDGRIGALTVPAALAAVLLVAACGGGGGDDGGELGGSGRDRVRQRPRVEQPAGESVEDLEPILVDLLERHDEVINEVLADPGLADDDGDPLAQEYLRLYSPDSRVPEQALETWAADAEAGRTTQPADPGHPAVASRIDGAIQTVSPDEVRFPTCNELRYATYDADGNLVDMVPYLEQPGEATAVRVEGEWVFQRLVPFEGEASCATEATTEEPS